MGLVRHAVTASIDDDGRVFGSKLHQTMQRLDPSFSYRAYNSTFTKFIKTQPGLKITPPRGKSDITVELADEDTLKSTTPSQEKDTWHQIDTEWSKRIDKSSEFLPGSVAAIHAAKVLGVDKLSTSQYKTLQGLLTASEYLNQKWRREANRVIRR